jgi:hypothetical protein
MMCSVYLLAQKCQAGVFAGLVGVFATFAVISFAASGTPGGTPSPIAGEDDPLLHGIVESGNPASLRVLSVSARSDNDETIIPVGEMEFTAGKDKPKPSPYK